MDALWSAVCVFSLLGLPSFANGDAPTIPSVPGTASIRRDQAYDVRVYEVAATDKEGNSFTCELDSLTPPFRVEKRAGDTNHWVYFDYAGPGTLTNNVYNLVIKCRDATETSAPGDVTVNVYDNRAPEFSAHAASTAILEDTAAESVLFTFSVSEPDSDPMFLSIGVSPIGSAGFFEFDETTGDVKLATGRSFDFETNFNSYVITCTATDGSLAVSSAVTINVNNVNEAPSLPDTISVVIAEGPPNSMSVSLTPYVSDVDAGDTHTFSILSSPYSGYFAIFAGTTLTNPMPLDREGDPPSPVTLTVVAKDFGEKTATAKVVVTLTDENDNEPVFQQTSYTFTGLYFEMPGGEPLGKVSATDFDSGTNQQIVYSLVPSSSTPADKFLVTSDGWVQLKFKVEEPYGTAMTLQVKATDRGVLSRSSTVDVTIKWNQAPQITSLPNSANVPEDPSIQRLLHTLVTSDDENNLVTCAVTNISPPSTAFDVQNIPGSSSQGVYYNGAVDLNRDVQGSYVVTVTARDDKGGETSSTLNVNVMPNLLPNSSCTGAEGISVPASSSVGLDVFSLTVSDVEKDVITITVTSVPDSGSFFFDKANKQVKVKRDLRNEAVTSHTMTLDISDGVNPPVKCVVSITITGPNQPPLFASHPTIAPVKENVPALTSLFSFGVTDSADSFSDVISVVWDVSPLADIGFFVFDDAAFTVKLASGQSFDFETKTRDFVITCTASDQYLQTSSKVTITILDTNDPPYFDSNDVTIKVKEGGASAVSFLPPYNVHDPDSDTLAFNLVPGVLNSDLFTINSVTGQLTNLVELDRDLAAPDSVSVKVAATDGEFTATTIVTIILDDINDKKPKFNETSYTFKVGLSTTLGTLIGGVNATDDDSGDNAFVDLVMTSQSPAIPKYFDMDAAGRIRLVKALNVDYGTPFSLHIEARDRGTPALTSTSVVEIIWNEGPKILNLPSEVYIHEDAAVKKELYSIQAEDLESDQFVCVKDSIVPKTAAFIVEDTTGNNDFKVFFTGEGPLSAATTPKYEMTVRCFDANAETKQVITIIVQPNTAPVLPCPMTVTVDAINTDVDEEVHKIIATDVEGDVLEYTISSTEFYVGTYTGVIRARTSLRTATSDQYSVGVTVSDNGHTASCTYVVMLTNRNLAPKFANLDSVVEVPEDTKGGGAVYVISVTDPNIFSSSIGMTWSSADKNKFTLDVSGLTATLKLSPDAELDYESNKKEYSFTFVASDGYLTTEQNTLTLRVKDVNEPPYFENDHIFYASFWEVNDPPEFEALSCKITDPDIGDKLTYELSGPNAQLFTMEGCVLTLATEYDIDKGLNSPITLTLTMKDRLGLSATASIVVTVIEINDNTPEFSGPVDLPIERGMLAGDPIGAVAAIDKDLGTNGHVSYSIITDPANPDEANKYITFLSTGKFVLRESMDGIVGSGENFQYVIKATDYGNPTRTSTTTVNIVYDPHVDITTTTAAAPTTAKAEDSGGILDDPRFIGILAGMIGVTVILGATMVLLACRYWNAQKAEPSTSNKDYNYNSRSSTPSRPNRISVQQIEPVFEGRKISSMRPLPGSMM